jgi:formate--tetrahydrofolate ligase
MAIMSLATDRDDLEDRLGRIIVGLTRELQPVRARDLAAQGAMTLLLKDALMPNLVQTLEGGPALVHCGPFGNIAHGCNSIVATDAALRLADIVVTESGFGADLGAEKFFDIKCRAGDFEPEVAVVVATIRALKLHGGVPKDQLGTPDAAAVERGFANLERHLMNLAKFGIPAVVAMNRFTADTEEELAVVRRGCETMGIPAALCEVWEKGGDGGIDLAEAILARLDEGGVAFKPLYEVDLPIPEKIERIATEIYGAAGVVLAPKAAKDATRLAGFGLGNTPVCVAKTQYSFSDDPALLGAPSGFTVTVREIYPSSGAGFVVALTGDIMTMPGLGRAPAAEKMGVATDGTIEGLF